MAKLVYKCNYDGKICNKEIPKLDENGIIQKAAGNVRAADNPAKTLELL